MGRRTAITSAVFLAVGLVVRGGGGTASAQLLSGANELSKVVEEVIASCPGAVGISYAGTFQFWEDGDPFLSDGEVRMTTVTGDPPFQHIAPMSRQLGGTYGACTPNARQLLIGLASTSI